MKRKHLMTVLAVSCCLTMGGASATALAEDTTEAVTEASTEADSESSTETEASSEAADESETETEAAARPTDYKALDYVTLGQYKGLTVQVEPLAAVTDEDVQAEADSEVEASGADVMETLTEGTVEEGDTVTIDYEGKLNGEAFDGGSATDYDLVIGSGTFIDGFEDGLIGVAVGDTVDLTLTFPENYGAEDLAGQEVVFTVTVKQIQRVPALTDEIVNTVTNGEYTDVDSWLASIRSDLETNAENARRSEIGTQLLTQIYNDSEISRYPEDLLNYSLDSAISYYEQMAEMYSMEYSDLVAAYGYTEEDFNAELESMIKESLQQELILKAVAETEGMEITDEEYTAGVEKYAAQYGYESTDDFVTQVGGEDYVRLSLLLDKAYDFLIDNAVVEEVEETETETESQTEAAEAQSEAAESADESETAGEAQTEAQTEAGTESEEGSSEAQTEAQTEAAETESAEE